MFEAVKLVDKKVILIIYDGLDFELREYKQCYYFKGTYSIRTEKYNYYCKESDDYFYNKHYCLILDIPTKLIAFYKFKASIRKMVKERIESIEKQLRSQKNKLSHLDKLN